MNAANHSANDRPKAADRTKSRDRVIVSPNNDDILQTAEEDGQDADADAGWVSAASSKTGSPIPSPDALDRRGSSSNAAPVAESPSSYQPLEFAKKPRRRIIQKDTFAEPLNLDPPASAGMQRQSSNRLSDIPSESTTPTRESALSQANPSRVNLTQIADDYGDSGITPVQEKGEEEVQPQPPTPTTLVNDSPATMLKSPERLPPNTVLSPPTPASAERPAPQRAFTAAPPAVAKPCSRPYAQRKSSTSTIRSLASNRTHAPLSPAMRKATGPLQPRLDTQGGIGGTMVVEFPSSTKGKGKEREQPDGSTEGDTRPRKVSGESSKAGTLTSEEAANLAKRLRTVSGGDLRASEGSAAGTLANRRSGLNRSASSASTTSLSALLAGTGEDRQGGVTGTLKRASGYFGSIGRLASLAGLTSTASDGNAGSTSPTRTLSAGKISPGIPAPGSSGNSTGLPGSTPATLVGARGRRGLPSFTQQQQQAGQRGSTLSSATSSAPPLISKFIDPNDTYVPFPKAKHPGTADDSTSNLRTVAAASESRARQKMMTQRDLPDSGDEATTRSDPTTRNNSNAEFRSSASEDDFSRNGSASQLNLRSGSSTPGSTTSGSTKLAPGVQRWIVALVKEAERIDKEYETTVRCHKSILKDSYERVLKRKIEREQEEEESLRKEEEANSHKAHR